MKQNSKYKCNHLHGETLVIVKKYNDKQYVAKSEETDKEYLVGIDAFTEPHLTLAHVANMDCQLVEIKGE